MREREREREIHIEVCDAPFGSRWFSIIDDVGPVATFLAALHMRPSLDMILPPQWTCILIEVVNEWFKHTLVIAIEGGTSREH